jgi:hypothetical protein
MCCNKSPILNSKVLFKILSGEIKSGIYKNDLSGIGFYYLGEVGSMVYYDFSEVLSWKYDK